jgi:hypothetical protein
MNPNGMASTGRLVRLSFALALRRPSLWLAGLALAGTEKLITLREPPPVAKGEGLREAMAAVLAAMRSAISPSFVALDAIRCFVAVWLLGALTALQGEPPRLASVLGPIRGRWRSIALFATLSAIGPILDDINIGLVPGWLPVLLGSLARYIWGFSLYLGIPVLAREPATGLVAVRRSWTLIRKVWRSRLYGGFLISLGMMAAAGALGLLASSLGQGLLAGQPAGIKEAVGGIPVFLAIAFGLVVDQIFDASLYVQLTEGVAPELLPAQPDVTWRAQTPG